MPIAQLYILEGRTDEQKERLIREVSEAMSRSIDSVSYTHLTLPTKRIV